MGPGPRVSGSGLRGLGPGLPKASPQRLEPSTQSSRPRRQGSQSTLKAAQTDSGGPVSGWRFFARLGAETSKPNRFSGLGFEVLAVWAARVSSGGGVGGEVNLPPWKGLTLRPRVDGFPNMGSYFCFCWSNKHQMSSNRQLYWYIVGCLLVLIGCLLVLIGAYWVLIGAYWCLLDAYWCSRNAYWPSLAI